MSGSVWDSIELILVAASLLATVVIAAAVWRQTRRHFRIEHSRSFIERFNSAEMVDVRRTVDDWLANPQTAAELWSRAASGDDDAKRSAAALRTLTNFFQELGVAYRHGALDRSYTWDVFGALSARYWESLEPYIDATRKRRGRPTLHEDFEDLAQRMRRGDERRGLQSSPPPTQPSAAPAWVFGYGSLLHPSSIQASLAGDLDQSRLQTTWLNGYRREWNVWDEVEFTSGRRSPLAYLGLSSDPGARCNGLLFPVEPADLEALDRRERNYERVEVSDSLETLVDGPVYTYVARPEFSEFPPGTALSRRYADLVAEALDLWGDDFQADYVASTDASEVADLDFLEGDYAFVAEAPQPYEAPA